MGKGKNLLIKKEVECETDQLTHVYTLIVNPDNTYEIKIDGTSKQTGSLEDDWDFLAPKKIKDPAQSKPDDWVDEAMMDDPEDKKPEGYDDIPKQIDDPKATKPEDWDDEADGTWEPPLIDNPEFKGEWKAKRISNPAYKGPWQHPEIDNPEYAADENLYMYESFGAVGIDIWQVKSGSIFDNIIITDDEAEAEALMAETFTKNKDAEKDMFDKAEEKDDEEDDEEDKKEETKEEKKEEATKKEL